MKKEGLSRNEFNAFLFIHIWMLIYDLSYRFTFFCLANTKRMDR